MDGFYQGEWNELEPEGVGKYFNQKEEWLIIAKFIKGRMIRDQCIKINNTSLVFGFGTGVNSKLTCFNN